MMIDKKQKVKDILDRECYEKWCAKQCQLYDNNLLHIATPCWLCNKNTALMLEIYEIMRLK